MDADATRSRVMATRAFRWDLLPKLERRQAAVLRAAASALRGERPGGEGWSATNAVLAGVLGAAPSFELGPVATFAAQELGARLAVGAPWVAIPVRRVDGRGFAVVVDAALGARLSGLVLGAEEPELWAPRAATLAERGALTCLCAAVLDGRGMGGLAVDGSVCDAAYLGALFPDPWIVAIELICRIAGGAGLVRILVPESLVYAPRSSGPLPWARLERVEMALPIAAAMDWLPARQVAGLSAGALVVFDGARRDRVLIPCGRGAFEASLSAGAITIISPYRQRGEELMSRTPDHTLAEDLPIDLTCRLGDVRLSARELLELGPGSVIPLHRPVGTSAELCAGGKLIARGEVVDIEGELGFRVLEALS